MNLEVDINCDEIIIYSQVPSFEHFVFKLLRSPRYSSELQIRVIHATVQQLWVFPSHLGSHPLHPPNLTLLGGSHTWPQLRLETWEQSFVLLILDLHIHPITRISSTYGVSISRLSLLLLTSVPARVIAKTIQLISLYPVWILSIYLPQCSESDHVKRWFWAHHPPSPNIRDSLPALRIQCNLILWLSKPFTSSFY